MLYGDQFEAGDARQVRTEASVLAAIHIEQPADAGLSQIGIDEQRLIAKLRQGHSEVGGRGSLAFAR